MKRYRRPDELAIVLNVSRKTIARRIKSGHIRAVMVFGRVKIPWDEFCRLCRGNLDCTDCPRAIGEKTT